VSQEDIQGWIAERFEVVEGDGVPVLFGLAHLTNSNEEVPVHAIKVGMSIWGNAAKMAEAFEMHATRYARGIMGQVQYRLGAVYKDAARPLLTMPFLKAGATNIGGGLGIDPSPLGQNMQGQRILDEMAMGVLQERRDVVQTQSGLIRMLSEHVREANRDVQATRLAFFELEEKIRATQHASKMAELAFNRSTMLLTEGVKYAPMIVNQVTGQKWIPEAVESAAFEEQWLAGFSDQEIAAMISAKQASNPAFAAFLTSRLAEIKKRKLAEAKLEKRMSGQPEETNGATPKPTETPKPQEGQVQPHIDVTRDHALALPAVRTAVEGLIVKLHESLEFEHSWEEGTNVSRVAFGNADGLTGAIDLADGKLRIRVVLPGMMRLMKGMILGRIEEELTRALATAAS